MADEGGREEASAREFGMPNSGGRSDDEMRGGGGESRTFRGELDEGPVAEIDDAGRIRTIRLLRRRVTSEPLHGHGEDRRVARAKLRPRGRKADDSWVRQACAAICSQDVVRSRAPRCNYFGLTLVRLRARAVSHPLTPRARPQPLPLDPASSHTLVEPSAHRYSTESPGARRRASLPIDPARFYFRSSLV
jgi:hypothetical protein